MASNGRERPGGVAEASARRVIAVGGSAGALQPLGEILGGLPADLPAAVVVVLHRAPVASSQTAGIVARRTALEVREAADGEALQNGVVYVAPVDRHLLVSRERLRVVRGPRENRSRPAIDPTFRTAARAFGADATAVLLSGMQSDGSYGLAVIQARGGRVVVQDPADAAYPDILLNALGKVTADHVLPARGIAPLLMSLLSQPRQPLAAPRLDPADDPLERGPRPLDDPPAGRLSPISCPECGGALWEAAQGNVIQYRCHVGHAFTEDVLAATRGEGVEEALWAALRALDDEAELLRRMARRAGELGNAEEAERQDENAADAERQAATLYALLMGGTDSRRSA